MATGSQGRPANPDVSTGAAVWPGDDFEVVSGGIVEVEADDFIPFLDYSPALRKIVYTTSAIESLNFPLRKITKDRGHFPNKDAAMKLIYLGLRNISSAAGAVVTTDVPPEHVLTGMNVQSPAHRWRGRGRPGIADHLPAP